MHVTILNGSKRVTNDDLAKAVAAVNHQVVRDVWPVWGIRQPSVSFLPSPPPAPPAHPVTVVDAIGDQPAGVLGYHTESKGIQWGVVAAGPVLDAGREVLAGDWSVASVISHEVIELLVDPACNLWASDGGARAYSFEACDPVEAPTYQLDGVSVSNFVLPAWFDPNRTSGRVDHLGLLRASFTMLPGGYCVWMDAGGEHQEFGSLFPDWRKAMKSGPRSRTTRRAAQADKVIRPF